jgi:hypothetical protein
MKCLSRVPRLSRPFFLASLVDAAAVGIVVGAVHPYAGVLARRLGASPEWIALLTMAPFAGFLLAAPVSRLLYLCRWGALLGSVRLVIRLPLLAFALVADPAAFVLVLAGSHLADGGAKTLFDSLVKSHIHESVRPDLLKWLRIAMIGVSVPFAWGTGRLLDAYRDSYRIVFPAAGLAAAVLVIPLFRIPRRAVERRIQEQRCGILEELRVLRADPRFLAYMLTFFVGTLAEKIQMPLAPIYFADVLNLRYEEVGMATGLAGPVLGVAGYVFWGAKLRRVSPLAVVTVCMFLKSAKPILWACASYGNDPVPWIVAGEAAFRFVISGMEMASILMVLEMSQSRSVPLYVGIHYLFMGVRGMIGPPIGLALYRGGMDIANVYWLVAALVVGGGFALLGFGRRHRAEFAAGRVITPVPDE